MKYATETYMCETCDFQTQDYTKTNDGSCPDCGDTLIKRISD